MTPDEKAAAEHARLLGSLDTTHSIPVAAELGQSTQPLRTLIEYVRERSPDVHDVRSALDEMLALLDRINRVAAHLRQSQRESITIPLVVTSMEAITLEPFHMAAEVRLRTTPQGARFFARFLTSHPEDESGVDRAFIARIPHEEC